MIEPLTGRRPVTAQILAMMVSSWLKGRSKSRRVGEARAILARAKQPQRVHSFAAGQDESLVGADVRAPSVTIWFLLSTVLPSWGSAFRGYATTRGVRRTSSR